MSYIDGSNRLPSLKLDAGPPPVGQDPQTIIRGADFNAVRNAVQELLDFAVGGGTRYPLTLTEPVGSSPTTAFRIVDNIGLETFSIKADGSFTASDKFQFGLGEFKPALELLQSTHVYTGNRLTWIGERSPLVAASTPTYGLVFIADGPQYDIYRSSDGGTWTKIGPCPFYPYWGGIVGFGDSLFVLANPQNGVDNFLHGSLDGGTTWTVVAVIPQTTLTQVRSLFALADGLLVIGGVNASSAPVFRHSADGGLNWTEIPAPPNGIYSGSALERVGSRWVSVQYNTDPIEVLYSDDEGVTWVPVTMPVGMSGVVSYPSLRQYGGDLFLVVTVESSTHVLRSTDLGSTWALESTLVGIEIDNSPTPLITSTGYLCVAVQQSVQTDNEGGYVARSIDVVSNSPITLEVVPVRVNPAHSFGPVNEIHQTLEFNGRIYGIGHGPPEDRLSAIVWSDDLTGANWLSLSDPITKLAPQAGYLDLGAKYLELTEPYTGAKYFSIEGIPNSSGEVIDITLTALGDLSLRVGQGSDGTELEITAEGTGGYGNNIQNPAASFVGVSDCSLDWGWTYGGASYVVGDARPCFVLYKTVSPAGGSWTELSRRTMGQSINAAVCDQSTGYFYVLETYVPKLWVSIDDGASWTSEDSDLPGGTSASGAVAHNGTFYAWNETDLYTRDGLGVWNSYALPTSFARPQLTVLTNGRLVVVGSGDDSLANLTSWTSDDGGQTWVASALPAGSLEGNTYYSALAAFDSSVYFATNQLIDGRQHVIVFVSSDSGSTWAQAPISLAGWHVINGAVVSYGNGKILVPIKRGQRMDVLDLISLSQSQLWAVETDREVDFHTVVYFGSGLWIASGHTYNPALDTRDGAVAIGYINGTQWLGGGWQAYPALATQNSILGIGSTEIRFSDDGVGQTLTQYISQEGITLAPPARGTPTSDFPQITLRNSYGESVSFGGGNSSLVFQIQSARPVDIEPLYLNLEGPVSTELLPIQNSTMLRFKAHFWDTGGAADAYYDAGIQYQILDNDPSVLSKLSFQIDGSEVASVDQNGVMVAAAFSSSVGTPSYGVVVEVNAAAGCVHDIVVTDGVGFTISNPVNPRTGQIIFIKVKNTSGGALGTVTWGAAYKMSTWTSPADGFSRSVEFYYDGTNWVQLAASGVDIPN